MFIANGIYINMQQTKIGNKFYKGKQNKFKVIKIWGE